MAGRGRPRRFKTVEELQAVIDEYKAYLIGEGKPPTIAGLAYYTGIDRHTIYNYKKQDEYFHTIKDFVDWIMMTYEETAIVKGNAGIIFLLKNLGYKDERTVRGTIDTRLDMNKLLENKKGSDEERFD